MREEHNIISVPNSTASESVVINYSYPDERYGLQLRLETVPIYHPAEVRKVLLDAVVAVKDVLNDPPPEIEFHGQGDSSAIYGVEFIVQDYEKRDDHLTAVWESIWLHLEQANIELATPCRFHYEFEGQEPTEKKEMTPRTMLEEIDLFQPFSEEAKQELSRHLKICRFPPGAPVMHQGENGDSLFIIAEGTLAVWVTLEGGNSIEIVRRTTGEIIGEIALLTGEPRTATVNAMTDAVLYEISKHDIAPFMAEQPELVERLSEILAERKMKTSLARESFLRQESQKKNLSIQFVHKIQRFFGI